jgi:hypothetical protein
MRIVKTIAPALVVGILVASLASAGPGIGFVFSPDFAGTGTSVSPIELSSNVTMPGVASVANATASYGLTVAASNNGAGRIGNALALKAYDTLTDGSNLRWLKSDGTIRWSMGNNSTTSTVSHDFWLFDNTNAQYNLYLNNSGASYLKMGTTDGRVTYDNATQDLTFRTNGADRCVMNASGLSCGGSAITGDITGVTAGTGLNGGGTSGGVTLNVGCQAGLTCGADDVALKTCTVGDTLIYAPNSEAVNEWQCAHEVTNTYRLDRYVVATTNGGITVTMDDTDTTARKAFVEIANQDFGDITTTTSSGSVWTIDNDVVTYAKMQNVSATSRFLGRITAGAGDPEELTGTQATSLLDTFSTSAATKGLVPGSSGGGASVFLNGNGAWTTPGGAGDITDVNVSATSPITSSSSTCSSGACSTTISTSMATARFIGRTTAGTGVMEQLTGTQATALLDQASTVATTQGVVPGSNGQTTKFLRGDMTWQTVTAGITNTASANYYGKSDGTNVVNGNTKDDGTNFTINTTAGGSTAKFTVVEASGDTTAAGTFSTTKWIESSVAALSSCGTSPAITAGSGTHGGRFTTGSGSSNCTITFGTAFANTPVCVIVNPTNGVVTTCTVSTTAITCTGALTASTTYGYWCMGGN